MEHIQWGQKVVNDTLATLDSIQLAAGFISLVRADTCRRLDYIDQGLIISLCKRLPDIEANIWIEEAWHPELQQENDAVIVELFADVPGVTPRELDKCNQVRLYLRVILIADIAHESGGGHTG